MKREIDLENKEVKKTIDDFLTKQEYYNENNDAYIIDDVTENMLSMRLAVNCDIANEIRYKYNAEKDKILKFSAGKARWQTAEVPDEFYEILKELHKRLQIFLK